MPEAYPLQWPRGRPRTKRYRRDRATVGRGMSRADILSELFRQLDLLSARSVVLSTNMTPRRDGRGYLKQAQPEDAGAAVYFTLKGRQMAFACDRWDRVRDNARAISKTIEALRGIERWGTGEMVAAAFTGFAALPESTGGQDCWEVLGLPPRAPETSVLGAFRKLSLERHPDHGGSDEAFVQLVRARDQALEEVQG